MAEGKSHPDPNRRQSLGLFSLFSAAQLGNLYEKQLKGIGVNPRNLPPQLHARISTVAQRQAEETCNCLRMTGQDRTEHIQQAMIDAADLVAMCTMGPSIAQQRIGYDPAGVIEDAASHWGPNGSTNTLIISAIDELVGLHPGFKTALVEAFNRQRGAA